MNIQEPSSDEFINILVTSDNDVRNDIRFYNKIKKLEEVKK